MTVTPSTYSDVLPVGYRLEEFRIDALLGQGGFSKVYKSTDTALGRSVAIKEYLPSQIAVRDSTTVHPRSADDTDTYRWGLKRFLTEARLLAQVSHPNVVQVLRVLEANNTAYFAMPFEAGMDLSNVLKKHGALAQHQVQKILMALLEALEVLHGKGIYHRDIKPKNVILRKGLNPLLIDFGAARTAFGAHTHSLHPLLSVGYSPIEQYSEADHTVPASDLYSLGALCYELISGARPVDPMQRVAASAGGRSDPLRPVREVAVGDYSERLLSSIDWALALTAEDRPQQVQDWRGALGDSVSPPKKSDPPAIQPSQDTSKPRLSAGRRYAPAIAGGMLSIAAVAALAGFLLHREPPPTPDEQQVSTASSIEKTPDMTATSDSPDEVALEIQAFLDTAERLQAERKLTTPAGNNAMESYHAVLDLDPSNTAARAGLEEISETYLDWASRSLQRGDYQKSLVYVGRGLTVSPGHEDLLAIKQDAQQARQQAAAQRRSSRGSSRSSSRSQRSSRQTQRSEKTRSSSQSSSGSGSSSKPATPSTTRRYGTF